MGCGGKGEGRVRDDPGWTWGSESRSPAEGAEGQKAAGSDAEMPTAPKAWSEISWLCGLGTHREGWPGDRRTHGALELGPGSALSFRSLPSRGEQRGPVQMPHDLGPLMGSLHRPGAPPRFPPTAWNVLDSLPHTPAPSLAPCPPSSGLC